MFHNLWDGFVDETCRANMPKAEACLYGELGKKASCFETIESKLYQTRLLHHAQKIFFFTFLLNKKKNKRTKI